MRHPDANPSDEPVPEAVRSDRESQRRVERSTLAAIALAGVVGALARYGVGKLLPTPPGHFPWSTFSINVSGSLFIGFVLVVLTERLPRARLARPLIVTGFLGAYTTFSTYVVDADLLFRDHDRLTGAVYAVSSLVAGLLAALAGVVLGGYAVRLDGTYNEQMG